MSEFHVFTNASAVPLDAIPLLERSALVEALAAELASGSRICAFFGLRPVRDGARPGLPLRLCLVLAKDSEALLAAAVMDVEQDYPALTPEFPALHLFEREIYEQFQVVPQGHPWLKPVRFSRTAENGQPAGPGVMNFFQVEGEGVHEVAVGPIHAGVIECGHFRFQCLGETVLHLEISLGYHHRGLEQVCDSGAGPAMLPIMESMAGDSSIAHAWAHCAAMEALTGSAPSPRAQALRAIALELERLANHTGDLGALAGDVGYLPTSSFCGRLRGDFLNMTAVICGNRFGRGLLRPGGVGFDLDQRLNRDLLQRLEAASRDTHGAVNLLWESPSVTSRLLGIGTLTEQTARDLGLVGPAARASGLKLDARVQLPLPGQSVPALETPRLDSGDVYARARIRQLELRNSVTMVTELLHGLPEGEICAPGALAAGYKPDLAKDSFCAALVEGWRGEVLHMAITGQNGELIRYKVVDPSFHNWAGLAMALRGSQISDFPLCNKSFNLSYCGVDL